MSTGHTTSAVSRPRASSPRVRHARPDSGPSSRSDGTRTGTRPVDDGHQLVTGHHRWLLALAGLAVLAAIVATLFVLPVRAWLRQEDAIVQKRQELSVLTEANRELGIEVDHLATPEGAKEAAREELGVVGPGEARISVLPTDAGPLALPAGWPYDTFTKIVALRQATPEGTANP